MGPIKHLAKVRSITRSQSMLYLSFSTEIGRESVVDFGLEVMQSEDPHISFTSLIIEFASQVPYSDQ